ncbi:hypothetical protein ACHAW6_004330 [Cyclotella cf. meneghiniana]
MLLAYSMGSKTLEEKNRCHPPLRLPTECH